MIPAALDQENDAPQSRIRSLDAKSVSNSFPSCFALFVVIHSFLNRFFYEDILQAESLS